MLNRKKKNNTVYSSINWPSILVNNVLVSKCSLPRFQHNVTVLFNLKLKEFPRLCVKKYSTVLGKIFLPGGENLWRIDFDESNYVQSYKQ